jgi:rhodanese-related sulfurtransferase
VSISEISVSEFMQLHNRDVTLVDVRETDEFESGHVSGAINIPLSEFAGRVTEHAGLRVLR